MAAIALFQPHIFRSIFQYLLEDYVVFPPPPLDNVSLQSLSGVCSAWRRSLLSVPTLWSNYVFRAGLFEDMTECLSIVESAISRSSSNLLSFRFEVDVFKLIKQDFTNDELKSMLFGGGRISILDDIIFPHANRLVRLECPLLGTDGFWFLFNVRRNAFPVLEVLDITLVNARPGFLFNLSAENCFGFDSSHSFPKLRRAGFRSRNSLFIHPTNLQIPFAQITQLDLQTTILPRSLFMGIMEQCRNSLVEGILAIQYDRQSAGTPLQYYSTIQMVSLRKLRLRLLDRSLDSGYMLMLSFPVLEELWVEEADRIHPFSWNLYFYTALLADSASTLRKLTLVDIPLDVQVGAFLHRPSPPRPTSHSELENLFQLLDRLDTLCLPLSVYFHQTTLEKIALGSLLPRLESLELGTTNPITVINTLRIRGDFGSSANSLLPSPLTSLGLTLPRGNSDMVNEIDEAARALGLN